MVVPSSVWFPLHMKAGIIWCAGEAALPSEKTFETVPISVIGPVDIAGFDVA